MPVTTSQIIIHQHHVHSDDYSDNCVSFVYYSPNVFKNNNKFPFITSVVVVCTISISTIASFIIIITISTCIIHKSVHRIVHPKYYLNKNNVRSSNDHLVSPIFTPITSNLNSSSNSPFISILGQPNLTHDITPVIILCIYLYHRSNEYVFMQVTLGALKRIRRLPLNTRSRKVPKTSVYQYENIKFNLNFVKTQAFCEKIFYIDLKQVFVPTHFYCDHKSNQQYCIVVLSHLKKVSNYGSIIRHRHSARNKNERGCYPVSGGNEPSLHKDIQSLNDMSKAELYDSNGKRATSRLNPAALILTITRSCNLMNTLLSSSPTTQAQCARYPCRHKEVRL